MDDIVTSGNEELFRQAFCIANDHSMECVNETILLMSKVACGVARKTDVPVEAILEQISVEQFEYNLKSILATKPCDCKRTGYNA